ncbi:uncharacterized protein [Haliotis asinina]|uniref:uncharacterized protein n=1 Tax=Haliotis asinina TaxID=109174 RepID=UPI003531E146
MSSHFDRRHPASKAVDGVTSANEDGYIVHTVTGQSSAWWKVDLQTLVHSAQIILYFRTNYKYRRNGVHLYTSGASSSEPKEGNLCHTVKGRPNGTDIDDVLNVTCPGTWRYLTVYTDTDNDGGGAILDFAEVQVWICVGGKYGPSCAQNCDSRHCKVFTSPCDHITGTCPAGGCQDGWTGVDCSTACGSGKYGANCAKDCSSRQCMTFSPTCDRFTGACPADRCKDGWTEVDCTAECKLGTYGPDCSRCGHCDITCNVEDGRCAGECLDGFTGDRCDVDVRDSVAKIGLIGGAIGMAIGMAVMLLVVVGLFTCLLKHGRIPANGTDPKEGRKKGYTDETPGLENPDYTELNDVTREREEKSAYDVVQSQIRQGEHFAGGNVVAHGRFGGSSVMIWGGVAMNGRTDIVVVNENLTGQRYCDEILIPIVFPFLRTMPGNVVFQDGNARPHRARIVAACLQQHGVNRME